jgi:hypothetical protein
MMAEEPLVIDMASTEEWNQEIGGKGDKITNQTERILREKLGRALFGQMPEGSTDKEVALLEK